jgi:hypothetical protein
MLLWSVVSCSCPAALLPQLPLFAILCSRFMLYRISGHLNLIDAHSYALVATLPRFNRRCTWTAIVRPTPSLADIRPISPLQLSQSILTLHTHVSFLLIIKLYRDDCASTPVDGSNHPGAKLSRDDQLQSPLCATWAVHRPQRRATYPYLP